MIKKCLILVTLTFFFAPVLLQAQGVDALMEYASSEHKAHFSTLYPLVRHELTTYYEREDFADAAHKTGWYRVDNFLKWVEKNEITLADTSILFNDKTILLKELYADLNNEEKAALFWGYLGVRYIFDEWDLDISKISFFVCSLGVCRKPAGKNISIGFETNIPYPVQQINIGIHEAAHARQPYEIPEFSACAAQNSYGLPVKVDNGRKLFFSGVRDFRVSYDKLGAKSWLLEKEYNECVIIPFFREWAISMQGSSKIANFCDVLKHAFPQPACQDCTFTQEEVFPLLQQVFGGAVTKTLQKAKPAQLLYAGTYTVQEILHFFDLHYQAKAEHLSDLEKQNQDSLASVFYDAAPKYSLYFYTTQGKTTALISHSPKPEEFIHSILPLGSYAIPNTDRLNKMEYFYRQILGKYAEKDFQCVPVLADAVQLLDELNGPQTRAVVPEGYI